jgi:hypothetical protein
MNTGKRGPEKVAEGIKKAFESRRMKIRTAGKDEKIGY